MSRTIVYGQPFHLHVRSVLFALKEKQVAYRLESRDRLEIPAKHASRGSGFSEPVLDVGGFVVEGAETALRFVADGFTGPALQPAEPRERARMNRALELNYAEASTTLGLKIAGHYLAAVYVTEWLDPQVSNDIFSNARKTVDQFERLLGSDQFLAGDRLSIADVAFGALLDSIMETPEGDLLVPQGTNLRN